MKYDYVAHLDPNLEETQFSWDALGLSSTEVSMLNSDLPTKYIEAKERKLRKMYKNVPRQTFLAVFAKYKLDYEMFGFDFDHVLKLAGHDPLTIEEKNAVPLFY